nr:Mobile element protein [uncultured bacterium]
MDLSSLTPDKQVKLQYWLDVIRQCRASGLTNQIWCEQHDISLKSYYYWLSKIRKLALEELPRKKNGIHMCTDQQLTALTESPAEFAELSLPDRNISRSTPAAMLGELSHVEKIYIRCGYTDMRKQLNGLLDIIHYNFKLDPYSNSLFLFCGKRADRIKAVHYEGDGFCLLYKRYENGRLQWPRTGEEAKQISDQQLRWLLVVYRDWLVHIVHRLKLELLKQRYLHIDETHVQVLKEPGRSGKYPEAFLREYEGYIHTDAYSGYNAVSGKN